MQRQLKAEDFLFLRNARWFAGKARAIADIDLRTSLPITEDAAIAIVNVRYQDQTIESYFVPVVLDGNRVRDGLANPAVCSALVNLMETETALPPFGGFRTSQFEALAGSPLEREPIRAADQDQSNSAVQLGDRLFLKVFRKLVSGINPDYEIARFLTEQTNFTRFPRIAGALLLSRSAPTLVATLLEWIPNEGAAWDLALASVAGTLNAKQAAAMPGAKLLGQRTAELHLALATPTDNEAFQSEPLLAEHCCALGDRLKSGAAKAYEALRAARPNVEPAQATQIDLLLERAPVLVERFAARLDGDPECTQQRIHGDYHLGQVLCQRGDFVLVDFEGEPSRSLEERRQKDCVLRDVAGMLRSFGYAAYAGLFAYCDTRPQEFATLEPIARAWQQATSAAFLEGYFATAGDAPFLPVNASIRRTLLDFFTFEKALYEVLYEANNRPTWLRIPMAALVEQL